MPRRPVAPSLAFAPALVVAVLSLSACLDAGSVPGSSSDTDASATGDVDEGATVDVDVGDTTAVSGATDADESTSTTTAETTAESTSSTTGDPETSASTTADTEYPETTTGVGEAPTDIPFDQLQCPTGDAIELIVPGRVDLVAFDTVSLYWRNNADVAAVQVWLSADGGESYPFLVEEVAVDGEGKHRELWDSTLSKIEVFQAQGYAKPVGYRMAIAAFDAEGQLVGCSEGEESFEIRGWPASAIEVVGDVWIPDASVSGEIAKQLQSEDLTVALKELSLQSQAADLTGLAHFTALEKLSLTDSKVSDFSHVSWMVHLKELSMWNISPDPGFIDLLGSLDSLERLTLRAGMVSPKDIPTLPNLQSLWLLDAPITDAEAASLPKFPALKYLGLDGTQITHPDSIPYYPSLLGLWLREGQLTNAAGLRSYPHLQSLDLSDNKLASPAGIPLYPELQSLYLSDNELVTLTGLPKPQSLDSLDLRNNSLKSVAVLPFYPHLRVLHLAGNLLSNLAEIPAYPELEVLTLYDNSIVALIGLPKFPSLKSLSLSSNAIVDVTPLSTYTGLTDLYLGSNNIQTGVKALAGLSNLTTLYLNENPNISCADQEYVKAQLLAKNPKATIVLSNECK